MESINDLFEIEASNLEVRREEAARIAREKVKLESTKREELEARQEYKIACLLPHAQQIITSLLANGDSKLFSSYLTTVFKKRGRYFNDKSGLCGFKHKAKKQKKTMKGSFPLSNEEMGDAIGEAIGMLSERMAHVRIITLYEETKSEIKEPKAICDHLVVDGESRPETIQVLALAVETENSFGEILFGKLQGARLVILSEEYESSLNKVSYSKADPISLDSGFIDALTELLATATAIRLFLEKFGLPDDKGFTR